MSETMPPDKDRFAYLRHLVAGFIPNQPIHTEIGALLAAFDEARAALARRDATIAAAQDAIEREWDRGNIAVAPIAKALSAPVEAVNIVGGTHTDPGNTELDDAIEVIVGDYVADTLVRTDLAKRVLAEVVKRTGLGVYDKPLPGAPAEPGYQRIADAIEAACDTAALALDSRCDGVPVEEPYLRLARVLDKAGLIDWSAFAGAPAEPTSDTGFPDRLARALHDADCGCGDYDEVEDPRYITAARAALAAASSEDGDRDR